jgi:NAD+ diphosphatase
LIREVREEIGIEIKNIRYFKSQPWPFSGSIMIGYFAEADDTQPLILDEKEIAEAGWFTRGNLPVHASNFSISGELIDMFEKGSL